MYNAVGGSTIHWSAHFPRFRPSDFRVRSLDGVADDWPIDYAPLEPYFDLNDRMMGVAGITGDPAYPPKSPRQTPPIPLDTLGLTIAGGFERLGWHWWPSDSAILTRDYDGRRACVNCGPCDLGCPIGAKASTDTYWPKAAAGRACHARLRARVTLVNGRADGVISDRGGERAQKARAVVLRGIGTRAALVELALGALRRLAIAAVSWVGTSCSRLDGRGSSTVLSAAIATIGCSIISQEFYETDLSRGFVRGYSFQVARGLSPIASANGGSIGDRVPWGRQHRRAYGERFDRTITVAIIGEDLPEPENRVDLDPVQADAHGIPAPRVSYRLSENSRRMLDHGIARAAEVLHAAGAREIASNPLLRAGGWHLMGTARMGHDPATSVVDAEGRCRRAEPHVVDGSVMVTCAGVNPTSTIQALALHIADGMIRRRS
jgi:choline dehydrogenase-like flavoprotein